MEDLCLKNSITGEQRKGGYKSVEICSCPFLLFPVSAPGNGKEIAMESLRDVRRVMEREAKKGSCPLMFEKIEFDGTPFQFILSEEKLDEVLAYLLRLKSFRQYAEKTVINNVYMDLDMLCRKPQFKRTHSVMEREGIYARVQRYKKKLNPDYENGLCLETVRCIFTLSEGDAEKCRMTHEGQETYAFIMSNKYILGLFTYCEAARKSAVLDGVEYGHLTEREQKIALLDGVGDVLFQALLLDDVEYGNGRLCANLHTIYCLNKK